MVLYIGVAVRTQTGFAFSWGREVPFVAAHRGLTRHAADNSLSAIEAAILCGADVVEIDVRRTRDGVLVAHHDEGVGNRPVASLRRDELSRLLRAPVATLDAIVDLTCSRTRLDVELKEAGYEREVLSILQRRLRSEDFIVTSFLPEALAALAAEEVVTGLLVETAENAAAALSVEATERTRLLLPAVRLINDTLLDRAREQDVAVVPWTVNRPNDIERFIKDRRVAGIITDVADIALAMRTTDTFAAR